MLFHPLSDHHQCHNLVHLPNFYQLTIDITDYFRHLVDSINPDLETIDPDSSHAASPSNDSEHANDNLKIDDTKIKYHPSLDRQPDVFHFHDYHQQQPTREPTINPMP